MPNRDASAFAAILAIAFAACGDAAAQALYKWVDNDGKTQYSDRPPKNYAGVVTRIEPDEPFPRTNFKATICQQNLTRPTWPFFSSLVGGYNPVRPHQEKSFLGHFRASFFDNSPQKFHPSGFQHIFKSQGVSRVFTLPSLLSFRSLQPKAALA